MASVSPASPTAYLTDDGAFIRSTADRAHRPLFRDGERDTAAVFLAMPEEDVDARDGPGHDGL